MRKLLAVVFFVSALSSANAQKDFTALVNPFIGTGGHGHTYPGASLPFGMMQLSPDTRMADWDGSSGYHYSDSVIYGFSHTHLSGTGIPDYCDLLLMPFTGSVSWEKEKYRSSFSHKNEKAAPGYYEVLLDKNKIRARLTTTLRSGMHLYEFPAGTATASILIDLQHRDQVLGSYLEQVSASEFRGWRKSRSWAREQTVFFYIQLNHPVKEWTIHSGDQEWKGLKSKEAKDLQAALSFDLKGSKSIRCRVGISGVSMEGALLNLQTEIKDWDFEKLKKSAAAAWNRELGKIEIKGGTKDQQVSFYTALYHTFLVPNIYQDADRQFRGTDLKVHKAADFTNYSVFSLWDTYRAYHPLMTIINQKRTGDWINTFLAQYQYGGMLPVWELSGNETFCMIGYHSVPVIVDAWQKGIRNFDAKLALTAMRSYAESDRFGLGDYRKFGYLSNDREHESVSKTLEYAYDDWCIATFAKMQGVDSVYLQYLQRAQYYKNVFDPETHNMRGKIQASWQPAFDPKEINNFFTEGNAWHYSFAVPQDMTTLVKLHGGKQNFAAKLNELFTTTSQTSGRQQADVTGLIGQYAQGNEPSHHMAYLFSYAGQPWRTQEIIHKICKDFYTKAPDGLIGNEDCGQMSAWYILSSMGFYPVCPGNGQYVLGTPLFDEVKIHLENGKQFVITASGREKGFYVDQVRLNGKLYTSSYLLHQSIMEGGNLQFICSAQPNMQRGTQEIDFPSGAINEEWIVPVPYFKADGNKIRDSLEVRIENPDPSATIFYSVMEMDSTSKGRDQTTYLQQQYRKPFFIKRSATIVAWSVKGQKKSQLVQQSYFRLPDNRSITVLSKVHPMYTAGGPDALIDGIMGSANWRTGEWQSYFDQDFEAVIDLKEIKPIHHVGIHVLQDISPWILYPKSVQFAVSDDGKEFRDLVTVKNEPDSTEGAKVKELGTVVQVKARYIRVKAISGGTLPGWHESAGNPSHLFIDEIIIR